MKLTILTLVYNQKNLLQKQYESLKSQAEYIHEWVVSDNASTDGTFEWVREITKEAPFSILGTSQLLNRQDEFPLWSGMKQASGDTVLTIAGDTVPLPDSLKVLHDSYVPGSVASGSRINVDENEKILSYDWRNPQNNDYRILVDKSVPYWWSFLTGNPLVIPVDKYEAVGGYDLGYKGYGLSDYDLLFRMGISGADLYQLNAFKVYHYDHPSRQEPIPESIDRFHTKVKAVYGPHYFAAGNGMVEVSRIGDIV